MELNQRFNELLNQNHTHFQKAATSHREGKSTQQSVKELEKQVLLNTNELRYLCQRLSALEKVEAHMDRMDKHMEKLPETTKDTFVDFVDEGGIQVNFNYDILRDIMVNKFIPSITEHLDNHQSLNYDAMRDIVHDIAQWDCEATAKIHDELDGIKNGISEINGRESSVGEDAIFRTIEITLERVLGTNRLKNHIKCSVAEKFAEVFRNNNMKKNVVEACKENSEYLLLQIASLINNASREINTQIGRDLEELRNEMKNDGKKREAQINAISGNWEAMHQKFNDVLACTRTEIDELSMKTDHNTKHFEVSLINAHKGNK